MSRILLRNRGLRTPPAPALRREDRRDGQKTGGKRARGALRSTRERRAMILPRSAAALMLATACTTGAAAQSTTSAGPTALDARAVLGVRTRGGYRLTAQALVKDACTAARFVRTRGTLFPPEYAVAQYRRPGTAGLLCIARLTWVTASPLTVASAAPPRYVNVRTDKRVIRVPLVSR